LLEGDSVNEKLDNYYANIQEQHILKVEKSQLQEICNNKLKKIKNSIDKITQLLKKRDRTEDYKLYGELLTANLYKKQDYVSKIEVLNYFTGENIIIELDPNKTLNENAQRYYKLYTKSKTTKEKSVQMLSELEMEKVYIENVLYTIKRAGSISDLEDIKLELGLLKQQNKSNITEKKNLLLNFIINGFEVFVGKNNKQNDYIILKLSKDEDFWFHTKSCAGSHVLLKVKEKEPDDDTILECCKLAREYSSAIQPSKVAIIFTKRKFIKKPPGAPLGYVTFKNEKEVLI